MLKISETKILKLVRVKTLDRELKDVQLLTDIKMLSRFSRVGS